MSRFTLEGKSVLVTGGAGFIGSHLVDRIVRERPSRLVVLDNLWLGRRENLADAKRAFPKLKLRVKDATSFSAVKEVVRESRIEVAFDLATIPLPASHVKPRWSSETIMKMATVLSELARLEAFETLVHCSSSEVYGTAETVPMPESHPYAVETPYAAAKAAGDLIVKSYWETFGIDATIVRPFNNYGPRQNDAAYAGIVPIVLRAIERGDPPVVYGDGEQTRDYMFVEDTAEAHILAYENPRSRRRVINVGSGEEITINDLVGRISALAGFEKPPVRAPPRAADVRRHMADVRLAKDLLGFKPKVSLDEGLRRTVAWFRSHPSRGGSRA